MPVPAGTRFPPVTGTPAGKRTFPASGAGATRAPTACVRPRSASSAWIAWARARGVPARPGRPSVASRPPAPSSPGRWSPSTWPCSWSPGSAPALSTTWRCSGTLRYTAGGPLHGVAAGEWYRLITSAFLAPATGLNGLGFVDILFNMWALVFVGPALEGSPRPGPLPRRIRAQRRRRRGDVLLPRAARTIWRQAPPAPSTGCSGRGSWCPGGCTSTPAGSSC